MKNCNPSKKQHGDLEVKIPQAFAFDQMRSESVDGIVVANFVRIE